MTTLTEGITNADNRLLTDKNSISTLYNKLSGGNLTATDPLSTLVSAVDAKVTAQKSALVTHLTEKGVTGINTTDALIAKIPSIAAGSAGSDYKMVAGPILNSTTAINAKNNGTGYVTRSFTLPFSQLGSSVGNCFLLFGIFIMKFTGGTNGTTASSTEVGADVPLWTLNVFNTAYNSLLTFDDLKSKLATITLGEVNVASSLNFFPTTASYSAGTYTAAKPMNNKSTMVSTGTMLTNGVFTCSLEITNTTYDYEYAAAQIYNPIYLVRT